MIAYIVRFRSEMSAQEVYETYESRAPCYRAREGLLQKYYLRFADTDEHGAVYIWESREALAAFRRSELARTIPTAYKVIGAPVTQTADVVLLLRPEAAG